MPLILALTAGIASTMSALRGWHRPATVIGLLSLMAAYTLTPILRPQFSPAVTAFASTWQDGVCLQSHPATCAPAAAATLLELAGVRSSENAMVAPCLTSNRGTEPLGLFRGLAIATVGEKVRPVIASSDPDTWVHGKQLPNIALVEFETAESDGAEGHFFGPQSDGHAVVIRGRDPHGNWIVLDPAFGRTLWTPSTFASLFTGDAIFLAPTEASRSD